MNLEELKEKLLKKGFGVVDGFSCRGSDI